MKLIKLSSDDPDIFTVQISAEKCDFFIKNFEAFMQMYRSQGETFWLRFLMSFKHFTDNQFCKRHQLSDIIPQFHIIRVLNYIYINIHKKFIEGSKTSAKKLINNLMTLALNSPSYLNRSCDQWLLYIKSAKQLHAPLQYIFGNLEPQDFNSFTAFIYSVYADFFCAVLAVFEHWYHEKDLSEEDVKKIDSKLIYWLPPYDPNSKMTVFCFEKYLSDHWKENLQRLLLTDNIHNLFSDHDTEGCCDNFPNDKNVFKALHISSPMDFMQELYRGLSGDHEDETRCDHKDVYHTWTEVCMKEICRLKPQVVSCTHHKKCFVRISHNENCEEPFMCKGDSPCILSCETELKKEVQVKRNEFWKTVSVELFPAKTKKRDVATVAESFDREIQTYLHIIDVDLDFPRSLLKQSYEQIVNAVCNSNTDPRKTECVNRLRKKLSEKNPSVLHLNNSLIRDSDFHNNLFAEASLKYDRLIENFCFLNGHNFEKCKCSCFRLEKNSVAISSCNPFGRVMSLSKSSITVPAGTNSSEEKNCSASCNVKATITKKSEVKKKKINNKAIDMKTSDNFVANDSSCKKKSVNKNNYVNDSNSNRKNANVDNATSNSKTKGNNVNKGNSTKDSAKNNVKDNFLANNFNHIKSSSVENDFNENKDNSIASNINKNKDSSVTNYSAYNANKNPQCSEVAANISDEILKDELTGVNIEGANCSAVNIDDDIDEILKLIGLDEDGSEKTDICDDAIDKNLEIGNYACNSSMSKADEKAVENFFKLIGVKDETTSKINPSDISGETKNCDKTKLKICAYCKKTETRRKMFKKCSRCKEENLPVHNYYCSTECLVEDWTESHEKEHLRFSKHSS